MPSEDRHPRGVVLLQTTIPDYRIGFFEALSERLGSQLMLLSGDEDWYADLKHAGSVPHVHVHNLFFVRRQLLWQTGAMRRLLGARVAVVGLNPRIVTCWIVLLARRLLRRRTVLWGHAWPRGGMASRTDHVRAVMRRLADTLIVYTNTEMAQLRASSTRADVAAAPNALYSKRDLEPAPAAVAVTDFVCVGRLNPSKKPILLLEAFVLAQRQLPEDVRLVFVGDGPLRESLESRARSAGLEGRILFVGHKSSLDELRQVYARAIASVSPGYVGLSLIQSLGFGVPMLIAENEPHAPEFEAAVDGENAIMFPRDSASSLAGALVGAANDRELWLSRRSLIAAPIRSRYSIENMVESFVTALRLDPSTFAPAEAGVDASIGVEHIGGERVA